MSISDELLGMGLDLAGLPRVAFVRRLHLVRDGRALCGRRIPEMDTYASHESGWRTWEGCPDSRCAKCIEAYEAERLRP